MRDPQTAPQATVAGPRPDGGPGLVLSGPASDDEILAAEKELRLRFPRSYRAFLSRHGSGQGPGYEIFGIPRDRVWGDVVMMNQLGPRPRARHFLKIASTAGGRSFFLDVARTGADQECPVVTLGPDDEQATVVASTFHEFLRAAPTRLLGPARHAVR